MEVIDISTHNTITNWAKIKNSGIGGVIIRAGYGRLITQKDTDFESNYLGAKKVGLAIGAYWYSYAKNPSEAVVEAKTFLQVIEGKSFELPVYFDIEESSQLSLGKSICTAMTAAFCDTLEKSGYYAGVYSYDSFFSSNLEKSIQGRYTCWVAKVGPSGSSTEIKPKFCTSYAMWQYSWKGSIPGVKGDVDLNHCYKDFPRLIQRLGLNGQKPFTYQVKAEAHGLDLVKAQTLKQECEKLGLAPTIYRE